MRSAIQVQWGGSLQAGDVNAVAMNDQVFSQRELRAPHVPGAGELEAVVRKAAKSAPGPDGLPHRAWVNSFGSLEILAEVTACLGEGGPLPCDLN